MVPVIAYGFKESHALSLVSKDFIKEYHKGGLSSKLIVIKLSETLLKVVLREVQVDPVTDIPIHVDFQLVKDDVPVKVSVLVRVINKDKSPGIKRGGVLNIVRKYIDLNCIPKSIPSCLEIDISGFEIGRSVHLTDVKLPVDVLANSKDDFTILTISGRIEEQEEVAPTANIDEDKEQKE